MFSACPLGHALYTRPLGAIREMKINRITFSIDKSNLSENQLKNYNKLTSYYEELILYFLPKNTDVGGYGFLNTKFQQNHNGVIIKAYGQIIEAYQNISNEVIISKLNDSIEEQIIFLGHQLKTTLKEASKEMSVDMDNFDKAITKANENYFGFERELKVSKYHKSRKFKVNICRVLKPERESIICRIIKRNDDIIDEFDLMENSSIYDVSYELRKSKWNENTLLIFDRFDDIKYSIDTNKYIE